MCTVMYVKVANYNRVSSLDSPKEEEAKFLVSKILDKKKLHQCLVWSFLKITPCINIQTKYIISNYYCSSGPTFI